MTWGWPSPNRSMASNSQLPLSGTVFISVRHGDKDAVSCPVAVKLEELGYAILATRGTAGRLAEAGIACTEVIKISQGRPHILDKIQDGQVQWILNTSAGSRTTEDSYINQTSGA
jgi:carbamoyl-phosphate synthase large subunit